MIDYLKPLIWVLLAVLAALGLHALLRLAMPTDTEDTDSTLAAVRDGDGAPTVVPNPAPAQPVAAQPPGHAVEPPQPQPPTPAPVVGAGIGRVGLAQWEQVLLQNGFAVKAHPTLYAGNQQYRSYVFLHNGQETAWAFLQAPTGEVVRLEFFVDGPETVTPVEQPGAMAGCQAILQSCRSLDQALADQIAPVLYSPYTGPDAFQPSPTSAYKGFAKDVGHYIALRLTARNDMKGGQFLLLWKDPAKKVGAQQNSIDFAQKCAGAKWDTFKPATP